MKNFELLQECKLQLEYLNEKFGETGTTNSLLAKLNQALHISGIGSKRPTDYEIDKIVTEIWNDGKRTEDKGRKYTEKIRTLFQAACVSGGEGTVAEGAGREIKDYE